LVEAEMRKLSDSLALKEYDLNMTRKKIPSEEDRHILRAYKQMMMHSGDQKLSGTEALG